jgi:glycosyltransferase involved in cell wall biosynthesis
VTNPQNIHISPAPIVNAGRIFKQTLSVARSGMFSTVIICGKARDGLPRQERLTYDRVIDRVGTSTNGRKSSVLGRIQEQVSWSMAVYKRYSKCDIGVVNAHSVAVLPVCYLLSRRSGAKLIYDTHELETETYASRGMQRRIFKAIERLLISKCDAVFVVNQSIADWYRRRYPALQPVVIRNIPSTEGATQQVDIRKLLSVPAGKRLFIFVGHLAEGRNIHTILDAFAAPEVDAYVVFMGDGQLEKLVGEYCVNHPNIHRLPPVSPAEVVNYVTGCDVGFCLTPLGCLSYKLSLPNKALEYVQAGVPFFFTDLPEVSSLLGPAFGRWRIKDPARDLTEAVTTLTASTIDAARAELAMLRLPIWDEEAEVMIATYAGLISPSRGVGELVTDGVTDTEWPGLA